MKRPFAACFGQKKTFLNRRDAVEKGISVEKVELYN